MLRGLILCCGTALAGGSIGQPICQIQGGDAASPYQGQAVTTEGVVTALFTGAGSLNGYFIQDPDCDGDPGTSDGVFVYDPTPIGIALGLRVRVTASVVEFNGVTELTGPNTEVLGIGTVPPTDVDLPLSSFGEWERFEGMLLRFPEPLVVTDNSDVVRYGELVLAPERIYAPSDVIDPNDADPEGVNWTGQTNVAAIAQAYAAQDRSRITLDDGRTSTFPTPTPWLGQNGTVRLGSTISDLTGVLHFAFGDYRLMPVGSNVIQYADRPSLPETGGGIRAASLNVLNYFVTLGLWGAQNSGEFERQRTKLVSAILAMDPDILALHELENNDAAVTDLLDELNEQLGATAYAALEEDGFGSGTRSVLFFKPGQLTPVGPLYSLSSGLFQRPHLTQTFEATNGGRFLFSTVHLRSKLCDNASGADLDQVDGQGCFNATRRSQVGGLIDHWMDLREQAGTEAQLIMGDFNAYTQEDPLDRLREAGFIDLLEQGDHSYRFQGQIGTLDHALATTAFNLAVTGAASWHINSDEPGALDYSDANLSRYDPGPFRCSDHDPILVGFATEDLAVSIGHLDDGPQIGASVHDRAASWWYSNGLNAPFRIRVWDTQGALAFELSGSGRVRYDMSPLAAGLYLWEAQDLRSGIRVGQGKFGLP